jgi:hypothetical protein
MEFGFDIISDLYLTANDKFTWDGKATSLYCLIPGNISSDVNVIHSVLLELSKHYNGIFYIDGALEHNNDLSNFSQRTQELSAMCKSIRNTVYLHENVVIVDGVALLGLNGWYGNYVPTDTIDSINYTNFSFDDLAYFKHTIEKLQLHIDVRKIIVVSNSVPTDKLYFGESPENINDHIRLTSVLEYDTEKKITKWVFGTSNKIVDTTIDGINYVNNPCFNTNPYYAKRLNVGY